MEIGSVTHGLGDVIDTSHVAMGVADCVIQKVTSVVRKLDAWNWDWGGVPGPEFRGVIMGVGTDVGLPQLGGWELETRGCELGYPHGHWNYRDSDWNSDGEEEAEPGVQICTMMSCEKFGGTQQWRVCWLLWEDKV